MVLSLYYSSTDSEFLQDPPALGWTFGGTFVSDHCPYEDKEVETQIPYDLACKWNLISEQHRTRYMEIKNKLTVTRGEGEGE